MFIKSINSDQNKLHRLSDVRAYQIYWFTRTPDVKVGSRYHLQADLTRSVTLRSDQTALLSKKSYVGKSSRILFLSLKKIKGPAGALLSKVIRFMR